MKKSNLIFALILSMFCYVSCTSPTNTSSGNKAQDTNLDDIVETPPEKKVNKAPAPIKNDNSNENKIQSTTGVFANIETGDYYYLHMNDEKNKETSFTIWEAYEGAAELNVDNWESIKGKKIKVTWQEGMEEIKEANDKMLVKKVLAVEVLD